MKLSLCLIFVFHFFYSFAQDYSADWTSLDNRPVPEWFGDAKFGIFVDWGIFSVPAYHPVPAGINEMGGSYKIYADRYIPQIMYSSSRENNWHTSTYGNDFSYFDFLPLFRAEFFDAAEWAELFKNTGAKYVVLTAKHSDGFAMWPAEEQYSSEWNAGVQGPQKDLTGQLITAIKDLGLRAGVYYSFIEYWTTNTGSSSGEAFYIPEELWRRYHIPEEDFTDHLHLQVKELAESYTPDIVWMDGAWSYSDEQLKSPELLAWIYNNVDNKEDIVVNDRWSREEAGEHGDFTTFGYGRDTRLIRDDKPWEKSISISHSFGYNRAEGLEDYKSPEYLIKTLVKTVSDGGNLLLTIGPRADGTIPLLVQELLLDVGSWLKKNGEAIYGSETWEPFLPFKTVNPKAGDEIFFTRKGEDMYVFLFDWDINAVSLKEIGIHKDATAFHLGSGKPVGIKVKRGGAILEDLPSDRDEAVTVIRIEGAWPANDD